MTGCPSASVSWNKEPIWGLRPDFSVRQLCVCWFGALSLTRDRVCRLQFLLSLASAVILGSESLGTRDNILLSNLLRLNYVSFISSGRPEYKSPGLTVPLLFRLYPLLWKRVLASRWLAMAYSGFQVSCHNSNKVFNCTLCALVFFCTYDQWFSPSFEMHVVVPPAFWITEHTGPIFVWGVVALPIFFKQWDQRN
jgi:hypothetical protein